MTFLVTSYHIISSNQNTSTHLSRSVWLRLIVIDAAEVLWAAVLCAEYPMLDSLQGNSLVRSFISMFLLVYISICMNSCLQVCTYECVCVCVCVCASMCVCVCVCVLPSGFSIGSILKTYLFLNSFAMTSSRSVKKSNIPFHVCCDGTFKNESDKQKLS
jgi:hypothetical protein